MKQPPRRNVPLEMMDKTANDLFERSENMAKLEPVYKKHRTFLLYALFGVGTVIVAMITYWLFTEIFHWHYLVGNVVSWILSTTFAFFTNRKWVFTKRARGVFAFFWQFGGFYFGRAITLFIEEWILLFFVGVLELPNMPVKAIAQIVVISLNWIISKLIVFRRQIPVRRYLKKE